MISNIFLNAETKHDRSTEQEIVHESDLTGDYKTAFNYGKQKEKSLQTETNDRRKKKHHPGDAPGV